MKNNNFFYQYLLFGEYIGKTSLQSNFALLRTNLKTGVSRKQSTPNFPKSKHFLPPDTHTYVCISGGKKCLFFGKFGMLCFLETPVLRIALVLYYRRYYLQTSRNLVFFMFEDSQKDIIGLLLVKLTSVDFWF